MPSTPITIAAPHMNHGVASPASSFSSSSSGLYVPMHKRRRSSMSRTDDSMSSLSSRPLSRADSHTESEYALVYSREQLLALAKSPLAVMSKEIKDGLRETVPEIVMSRKYRKAMEYRARTAATQQNAKTAEPQQQHQTNLKKPLPEQRALVNVATQPRHHLHALPHQHQYQEKRWSVSTRPDAIGGMSWRRTAAPPSISVA